MNEPETIDEMLKKAKTIAVVGLSNKPHRASFGVSRYMQRNGYRIVPVNPSLSEALGEKSYPSLEAAQSAVGSIDMVNVFRAPSFVPGIIDDAIRLKIPYLWLQQGIRHDESTDRAEAAGLKVVADRCLFQEHMAVRSQ